MAHIMKTDWRENKTSSDCNRFMLENEIATDVCFEVGPPGGKTDKIGAHEYMLASRSHVFETMFYGGLARNTFSTIKAFSRQEAVRVDDIDAETFKEMLRFIYYDDCAIVTLSSAPSLLYVAKKYMLSHLYRLCCECLQKGVSVTNVGNFMDLSLLFEIEDLRQECVKLISDKAGVILTGSALNNVSDEAMELILDLDRMAADESIVFLCCVSWAKHKLRNEQFIENPNDQQIRKVIDFLIHRIRFPTMNPKEFAELVAKSGLLTPEERSSVFCYFVTKSAADVPMFNVERRNEFAVKRFSRVEPFKSTSLTRKPSTSNVTSEVNFRTNKGLVLTAVALFCGKETPYCVNIEIFSGNKIVAKQSIAAPFVLLKEATYFKVTLDKPVNMCQYQMHRISICCSVNSEYYGSAEHTNCTIEGVNFSFFGSSTSSSKRRDISGQIPILYFQLAGVIPEVSSWKPKATEKIPPITETKAVTQSTQTSKELKVSIKSSTKQQLAWMMMTAALCFLLMCFMR